MRMIVGILSLAGWLLYVGQLISALNFGLAQRLGLQESPDSADPLLTHLELWAARWDLAWLWTLPVAGILMLLNHSLWPYASLIGGGAFVDAGGREAAKILGLRGRGVHTGTQGEHRLAMGVYLYLIAIGAASIVIGLLEVL
ncbi:MAG: hypothetical protein KJO31_14500 [Gammaproteobacteria bacterium]|nr:hypothetical protein [Gammaproteobacteria bacterium]